VVTLTVLLPVAAGSRDAHVALTVVAVGGVTVLMVQTTLPAVPDTFTAVVPDRLLPLGPLERWCRAPLSWRDRSQRRPLPL